MGTKTWVETLVANAETTPGNHSTYILYCNFFLAHGVPKKMYNYTLKTYAKSLHKNSELKRFPMTKANPYLWQTPQQCYYSSSTSEHFRNTSEEWEREHRFSKSSGKSRSSVIFVIFKNISGAFFKVTHHYFNGLLFQNSLCTFAYI